MFFTYYSNVNFMPPFGTDAPLTPKGGKYLFIRHLNSFSLWGKDVRRTGWGLFKYSLIKFNRAVLIKRFIKDFTMNTEQFDKKSLKILQIE